MCGQCSDIAYRLSSPGKRSLHTMSCLSTINCRHASHCHCLLSGPGVEVAFEDGCWGKYEEYSVLQVREIVLCLLSEDFRAEVWRVCDSGCASMVLDLQLSRSRRPCSGMEFRCWLIWHSNSCVVDGNWLKELVTEDVITLVLKLPCEWHYITLH